MLGHLDELGVGIRRRVRRGVRERRREDLVGLGRILGRVEEQEGLRVRENVLQLGRREGGRERQRNGTRRQDGEEID